jgi:hypothetical protein
MDHMAIRQNETIRREDKTGAAATHLVWKSEMGHPSPLWFFLDFDIDDRWANSLRCADDGLRVRIKKLII